MTSLPSQALSHSNTAGPQGTKRRASLTLDDHCAQNTRRNSVSEFSLAIGRKFAWISLMSEGRKPRSKRASEFSGGKSWQSWALKWPSNPLNPPCNSRVTRSCSHLVHLLLELVHVIIEPLGRARRLALQRRVLLLHPDNNSHGIVSILDSFPEFRRHRGARTSRRN